MNIDIMDIILEMGIVISPEATEAIKEIIIEISENTDYGLLNTRWAIFNAGLYYVDYLQKGYPHVPVEEHRDDRTTQIGNRVAGFVYDVGCVMRKRHI